MEPEEPQNDMEEAIARAKKLKERQKQCRFPSKHVREEKYEVDQKLKKWRVK